MTFNLTGKIALISGVNGGIGAAVAQAYHTAGATVCGLDIQAEPRAELANFIHYSQADLAEAESLPALIDTLLSAHGQIDILYNNAALFEMAPLLESDLAMFDRLFQVNVRGLFALMQATAASMVERKVPGRIINMASQAGRRGEALVSHYCATKAAVISYTQSAALALAPHGITVNAISPGVIDTPMWQHVDALFARYEGLALGEKKRQVGQAVPLGRMGRPEDLIGASVFLASDSAAYITGQTLNVDGGNVLS